MPGTMTVGGGVSDVITRGDGRIPYAPLTFWTAAVGGVQYTDATPVGTETSEGGVVVADAEAAIPATVMAYAGDNPGGAWVECTDAWGTRRWAAAHGAGSGGGGGGVGDDLTLATLTVGSHVVFAGGWLRWTAAGVLEKSTDAGTTWVPVDTTGGGGGVTLPTRLGVIVWHSEGSSWTARPAEYSGQRIIYVNPALAATAPTWLSSVDIFLTKVSGT